MGDLSEQWLSLHGVFFENLADLSRSGTRIGRQRLCELSLMAKDLVGQMSGIGFDRLSRRELLAFLSSLDIDLRAESDADLKEADRGILDASAAFLKLCDEVFFASELIRRLADTGVTLAEADFFPEYPIPPHPTVSYVKNPLSDEAFDALSVEAPSLRVSYAPTLRASVEAVKNLSADFCLLPLEEAGGARIASTAELIAKNDLKIVSVTPVFGLHGEVDIRYALVGREVVCPPTAEGDDCYLEVSLQGDMAVSSLIDCAEMLGFSIYRVSAVREEGVLIQKTVLSSEGKDFVPLLLWSLLFCEGLTPVGIYTNLE